MCSDACACVQAEAVTDTHVPPPNHLSRERGERGRAKSGKDKHMSAGDQVPIRSDTKVRGLLIPQSSEGKVVGARRDKEKAEPIKCKSQEHG